MALLLENRVTTLRGRPQCFKPITIRFDQMTHDAIVRMANEECRPMTEVIRELIELGRAAKEDGSIGLEFVASIVG